MTHEEAQALWLLAGDDGTDPGRRREVESHVASCPACRAEIDRLEATDEALREWGATSMPAPERSAPGQSVPIGDRPWWPMALAAALAGITLGLAGGFAAGRRGPERSVVSAPIAALDSLPRFVLMLEEPTGQWPPSGPLMRPGYFEWMDSLVARGQYADGLRLSEDDGWYLPAGGAPMPASARAASSANFSGFFVIRARDYDEAVAIAGGSPHLAYGGVLIRRTF
ncbi:MAG TPA: zf-HC2 domain-containing protein [Gemmatimonadaceae bacterium]